MNFFGHAVLAHERDAGEDPRFVLGAMFPDFCSMARLRLQEVSDPVVAEGVAFHHVTDDAFHGAPLFLQLMHDAQERLEEAGVSYGPALAVGHVGVELLLDGWLAARIAEREGPRRGAIGSFRAALEAPAGSMRWRDGEQSEARWRTLRERLRDSPLPEAYGDPAFVADRMVFILKGRPRLALDEHGAREVARWAPEGARAVAAHADALLEQVRGRLERATER